MIQNLTIKDLSPDDRPREKLMLRGRKSLTDSELLAIILGSGSKNKTAIELAQEILLYSENDINLLGHLTFHDLIKFKGVGEAKAVNIIASMEFGRRRAKFSSEKKIKVRSSNDVYNFLKADYQDLKHEECYIILLNRNNEIIRKEQVSKGGVSGTIVDAKIIFKMAFDFGASSMILSHNHPSGNLQPSIEDKKITEKIKDFGKMIELPLLDHLIFADNGYFSFSDNGEF